MEPELHTGDLVLTRSDGEVGIGDTVLITVMGGFVIHDVIWKSEDLIKTQGINNKFQDSWVIPKTKVLGKKVFVIPGFGSALIYFRDNPLILGLSVSAIAFILLLEPRRHRYSHRLKKILGAAKKEEPTPLPNYLDALLIGLFLTSLVSLLATGILLANRSNFYPRLALSLIGVIVSVTAFEIIGSWVFNGRGLREPYKSFEIFRNRLFQLPENTIIPGETIPVESAQQLMGFAKAGNSPIIHQFSEKDQSHRFFLITDDLNFVFNTKNEDFAQQGPRHKL